MRMRGSAEYRTNGNVRIQIMMFAMFIQWSTSGALHRESFLGTSFFSNLCFEYEEDRENKSEKLNCFVGASPPSEPIIPFFAQHD